MGGSSQEEWEDIQCVRLCFKRKARSERGEEYAGVSVCTHVCMCVYVCVIFACVCHVVSTRLTFPSLMSPLAWISLWHNPGSAGGPSAVLWSPICCAVAMATEHTHTRVLNYIIELEYTEEHKILSVQCEQRKGKRENHRDKVFLYQNMNRELKADMHW